MKMDSKNGFKSPFVQMENKFGTGQEAKTELKVSLEKVTVSLAEVLSRKGVATGLEILLAERGLVLLV